jgi:hypothetical protein
MVLSKLARIFANLADRVYEDAGMVGRSAQIEEQTMPAVSTELAVAPVSGRNHAAGTVNSIRNAGAVGFTGSVRSFTVRTDAV